MISCRAVITFYNALPLFDPPKFKVERSVHGVARAAAQGTAVRRRAHAEPRRSLRGLRRRNRRCVRVQRRPRLGCRSTSLRFRAGIARAVRAPSLVDLYSEQSQNFATINDPCSARNHRRGCGRRVAANCAAAGVPALVSTTRIHATPEILSGGNPELTEETSDSFTVGLVFQPEFAPGLSFSVDYFDIDIDDVITAPTAQQIMDACYDAPDLNNQFCGLFQRWGAAGGPNVDDRPMPYALSERHAAADVAELRELHGAWHRLRAGLQPTRPVRGRRQDAPDLHADAAAGRVPGSGESERRRPGPARARRSEGRVQLERGLRKRSSSRSATRCATSASRCSSTHEDTYRAAGPSAAERRLRRPAASIRA